MPDKCLLNNLLPHHYHLRGGNLFNVPQVVVMEQGTATRSAGVRVTIPKQAVQEFQDDVLVCCMFTVLVMCMLTLAVYLLVYLLHLVVY